MVTKLAAALFGALLFASAGCFASIDTQCFNACVRLGNQQALCLSKCSPAVSSPMAALVASVNGPNVALAKARQQLQLLKQAEAACKQGSQRACADLQAAIPKQ